MIGDHDDYMELLFMKQLINEGFWERWKAENYVRTLPENYGCDSRADCCNCENYECPNCLPF